MLEIWSEWTSYPHKLAYFLIVPSRPERSEVPAASLRIRCMLSGNSGTRFILDGMTGAGI